ncbi:MAG: electron-transfer flavoprotein:ubiquinone oxidoreductase [Dehalococcoidales bacterium]
MSDLNKIDALFIGAGVANLAGAIKLKQLLNQSGRDESVVVIEKADRPGQHNLSGAIFEADVLDGLLPDWRTGEEKFVTNLLANEVKRDEMYFLAGDNQSIKIPHGLVPKAMRHDRNYVISVSEMVNWLAGIATKLGVEIYTGFAAKEVLFDGDKVIGVKLGDKGLDKEGKKLANYIPGENIEAKVTILGEGSAGQLAEGIIAKFKLAQGKNPQIHSVGVKEVIKLPEGNQFGDNRVIHTVGYPLPSEVFGGGTVYSMGNNTVAVTLMMSLDWSYCNFNPQQELQRFKSQRFIKSLIEGGRVISYGAKTLPEGGYYALPQLFVDGALIVGDDAGLPNVQKLKGLHYAVQSGIFSAETVFDAIIAGDFSSVQLKNYQKRIDNSFIGKDLYSARNYRQVFGKCGLFGGIALSFFQQLLPRLRLERDYKAMRKKQLQCKPAGGLDRPTAVSFSGTHHREDEPSHITFKEENSCVVCFETYGCHPCESFCPAEVYKFEGDKLILSPSNCVHCQTCRLKCPLQSIIWQVPEGGDGPKYKNM